jgi:hypothetical protein
MQITLNDARILCNALDEYDPFTGIILRSRGSEKFKERLIEGYSIARLRGRITSDDLPHTERQTRTCMCPYCYKSFEIPDVKGDRINGMVLKVLERNKILIHTGRVKSTRKENHATTIEMWEFNNDWSKEG